jgi:hypothetical protein
MLYFLAIWTLLLLISGIVGFGLLHGLGAHRFDRPGDRVIMAEWSGVVALAIALLTTSLFLPLSPLVGAIVVLILCVVVLAVRSHRTALVAIVRSVNSPKRLAVLVGLMIAVAAWMTQEVTWSDTGLYHYSNIQWFAGYGSVPGIALLFPNYGFTSSWFALAAPFNAEILDARGTATTNGFVLLLVVCQLVIHLRRLLHREGMVSDWFMVIFLLMIPPIAWMDGVNTILISPSPDIPLLLLVGVIAWCFLTRVNHQAIPLTRLQNPGFEMHLIPLILATGALTIKLTAVPLWLVTSLFYSYARGFKFYRWVVASGIAILLMTPVFAHSIIASGCPLYPSSLLCLDLPWSLSPEAVQETAKSTHEWMSWVSTPPPEIPRWLWAFWRWFHKSTTTRFMAFLLVVNSGCLVYLCKRKTIEAEQGKNWVMVLAVTGIVFFLATAPFFRFSLSYLILLPALSVTLAWGDLISSRSHLSSYLNSVQKFKFKWAIAGALPALLVAVTLHGSSPSRLVLPPPLKHVPVIQKQARNFLYWSPKQPDELCWATKIPCTTLLHGDVILRDPERGFRSGFVRQLNSTQKST